VDTARSETEHRSALRLLVDSYASHVDHRDVEAVAALFSDDGRLVAHFHTAADGSPTVRTGRADILAALVEGLRPYERTTHVVGGHVVHLDGVRATGETTCLAHHVYERRGQARLLILAVRYQDAYVWRDGVWQFAERQLRLDWRDDRPLGEYGLP
jgi:ketosteroid isomerase-like protein